MNLYKRIMCCALLLFCSGTFSFAAAEETILPEALPQDKTGWIAYWDAQDGLTDSRYFHYSNAVLFAADFNKKNKLVFPEEFSKDIVKHIQKEKYEKLYLSFVNDKRENGKLLVKDTDLLEIVLKDEKARSKHINDIIRLTKSRKCNGIEIDYENIWRDEKVMQLFTAFIGEMHRAAALEQLPLRIVLEPKTLPYAEQLPAGPEYVVMLYNLHGRHNGPGPKADFSFIRSTLKKMQSLPGEKSVAFAAGGYRWENGKSNTKGFRSLTQRQAEQMRDEHKAQTLRDPHSGALHYFYQAQGNKYDVWYADKQTIEMWNAAAKAAGAEKVSIWRLGGNS